MWETVVVWKSIVCNICLLSYCHGHCSQRSVVCSCSIESNIVGLSFLSTNVLQDEGEPFAILSLACFVPWQHYCRMLEVQLHVPLLLLVNHR